ncbi:MAG: hypothetical protein PHN32_07940 [Actinomycetota bacterium]|nr:hypothetical protein [Actinomycetota bacterium]
MLNIIIGIFFILHGLVHAVMIIPSRDTPGKGIANFYTGFSKTKILNKLNLSLKTKRIIAVTFSLAALAGFLVSAFAVFTGSFPMPIFLAATIAAASLSTLLIIFFWHPYLTVGLIINLAILVLVPWWGARLFI